MRVQVHYTAQLKSALGVAAETVELPDECSLVQLFGYLARRHGNAFTSLVLTSSSELKPATFVCVNNRQCRHLDSTLLQSDDVVTLVSAISGG